MDMRHTRLLTPQDFQDSVFRRMSVDQKLLLGSQLWRLAQEIKPAEQTYGSRSTRLARSHRKNSR